MKRFSALLITAAVLTAVIALSVLPITTSAKDTDVADNVVFISDSAAPGGDGTSADKPLYPSAVPESELDPSVVTQETGSTVTLKSNYKKSALYQAIEKLSATGGTVVICGNVTIDSDISRATNNSTIWEYHTPWTEKTIKITSVYDGVDYRSEAVLTLSGYSYIMLNCPTVWENMNIVYNCTKGDRAICCRGNKTVFGEGLNCTRASGLTSSNAYYYSIVGGERYKNFTGDTDVTIKSGTFYKVLGTSWANSNTHTGDTHIRVEGGTITTMLCGNSNNTSPAAIHNGNVYMTITGGTISSRVTAMGVGGFSDTDKTATVKVTGGAFSRSSPVEIAYTGYTGNLPGEFIVDISDTSSLSDTLLNKIITTLPTDAKVIYPAHWASSVSAVSVPEVDHVFVGDTPDMSGAAVNVTFVNPVSNAVYSQSVKYTKDNGAFSVVCDTATAGTKTASFKYGNKVFHTATVKTVLAPFVTIEGAQIRIDTKTQQLRFWAEYTNEVSEGVEIVDCGVITVASDLLVDEESFNHKGSSGMYDTKPGDGDVKITLGSKTRFTAVGLDGQVIRENNFARDYSARAYVKVSYNGKEYYRYSDVIERSPYLVALNAAKGEKETAEIKEWLKLNVTDVYENYDETRVYDKARSSSARSKVVTYMESMRDIKWTPAQTFIIYNEGGDGSTKMMGVFYKGVEYTGLPYINYNMSQTESFLDMMKGSYTPIDNQNISIKSNSDWSKLTAAQKAVGLENAKNFPGNDCVGALILAWNSVLTNREEVQGMRYTSSVIPGKGTGVIAVGDYDYSNSYGDNTDQMIAANGEQRMAEAYAKLLPGDGTIYVRSSASGNPRHSRLVVKAPVVVRNTDGTINLEKSYVTCMDQAGGASSRFIVGTNLTSIHTKDRYFSDLITEGSLPITIPELATGNMENEFTYATKLDLEADLPEGKLSGVIRSNRQIISVRAVIRKNGNVVREIKDTLSLRGAVYHTAEYKLSNLDLSGVNLESGMEYTFDLYTCVSGINGREVHLVDGYNFIAE